MKEEDEIQDMADRASDASRNTSRYPSMKYEEGVRDALDWVLGNLDDDDDLLGPR